MQSKSYSETNLSTSTNTRINTRIQINDEDYIRCSQQVFTEQTWLIPPRDFYAQNNTPMVCTKCSKCCQCIIGSCDNCGDCVSNTCANYCSSPMNILFTFWLIGWVALLICELVYSQIDYNMTCDTNSSVIINYKLHKLDAKSWLFIDGVSLIAISIVITVFAYINIKKITLKYISSVGLYIPVLSYIYIFIWTIIGIVIIYQNVTMCKSENEKEHAHNFPIESNVIIIMCVRIILLVCSIMATCIFK